VTGRTLDSEQDNVSGRFTFEWLPGASHPGLTKTTLIKLEDGTYTDTWRWDSPHRWEPPSARPLPWPKPGRETYACHGMTSVDNPCRSTPYAVRALEKARAGSDQASGTTRRRRRGSGQAETASAVSGDIMNLVAATRSKGGPGK